MANKDFGVKRIELIGSSGTPNLTSPTNLNLNANTVAISTDVTIGGKVQSDLIVASGFNIGVGSTQPQQRLDVVGTIRADSFVKSDGSAVGAGDTANIVTGIITAVSYYGDGSTLSGIANVSIGDTAPSPATDNTLWWSSALAKGFIRYNDGNSSQWVEFSPSGGGGSGNIVGLSTAGNSYFTNIDVNNQSSLTNLNVSGFSTLTNLNVSGVSTFGSNLEIYVDGSDSVIREGGAGNLEIKANGIQLQEYDGTVFADFNGGPSGWQRFYHDGSNLKLEVNANGIDVTGRTETDTLRVSGVSTFGSGGELEINQDAGRAYLIAPNRLVLAGPNLTTTLAAFRPGGSCSLNYDDNLKLETSASGITVTGGVNVSGVSTFSGDISFDTTVANAGIFFDQDAASLTFKDDHAIVFGTGATDGMIYSGTFNSVTGVHFRGTSADNDLYRWGNFIVGPSLTSGHRLAIFKEKGTDGLGSDGGVELYYQDGNSPYNTAKRFETTVSGVTITGGVNASGVVTATSLNVGTAYSVSSDLGTFTASAGVSTNVASFNASDYKVVEYKLWIQHANGIQSQKVIIMHDDNDVYTQESDIFYSNTLLIGAGATISGGTVSLALTAESGVNGITTYRYSRESLV